MLMDMAQVASVICHAMNDNVRKLLERLVLAMIEVVVGTRSWWDQAIA